MPGNLSFTAIRALEILKPKLQKRADIAALDFFDHSRVWSQKWFDEAPFARFGISPRLLLDDFVEASSESYGKLLHLPPLVNIAGLDNAYAYPPEQRGHTRAEFLSRSA